jgi:hypothetical protein
MGEDFVRSSRARKDAAPRTQGGGVVVPVPESAAGMCGGAEVAWALGRAGHR